MGIDTHQINLKYHFYPVFAHRLVIVKIIATSAFDYRDAALDERRLRDTTQQSVIKTTDVGWISEAHPPKRFGGCASLIHPTLLTASSA